MEKIYIAGHTGLVGSAIARHINKNKRYQWIGKTRQELNLLHRDQVFEFINKEKPDALIVAAAKVGGIKANSDFPVEFLSENLQIALNLINAAHEFNVDRLVFLGSSCAYPKFSLQPIKEEYLLSGSLESTNEAYALSKIAGLKLVESYNKQYGRNWISIMPTNVYGPLDNFEISSSHVLPALIRKFHEAKVSSKKHVNLWGSGNPMREFIFSDDLADAIIFLMERRDQTGWINVGTGSDIKISELAEIIKEIVEYDGEIVWDKSMPDGTPKKLLNVSRMSELGWKPRVALKDGIRQTYNWYLKNY